MPASLNLYNSLTRQTETLSLPTNKVESVGIYTCGPTVYDRSHIGNLYSAVIADLLVRCIKAHGHQVKHVINITDFGHLGAGGQDKMTKGLVAAGEELTQANMLALGQRFKQLYQEDLLNLGVQPTSLPSASQYVTEMIAYIEVIIANGFAYPLIDGIYFETSQLEDYLVFASSGGGEAENSSITPVIDKAKKSNRDFVLWKLTDDNQGWNSPWGQGYPGWHIECSAMSQALLSQQFAVHTGGIDLEPIHHTNEVAQATAANGHGPAKIWMHNAFLRTENSDNSEKTDTKMSKSTNTGITLDKVVAEGYHPLSLRLLMLQSHYRTGVTYSQKSIAASQELLQDILNRLVLSEHVHTPNTGDAFQALLEIISDEIDTPQALRQTLQHLKDEDVAVVSQAVTFFDQVLGLDFPTLLKKSVQLNLVIAETVTQRDQARLDKNWTKADQLRDNLISKNYLVFDKANRTVTVPQLKLLIKENQ